MSDPNGWLSTLIDHLEERSPCEPETLPVVRLEFQLYPRVDYGGQLFYSFGMHGWNLDTLTQQDIKTSKSNLFFKII